MITKWIQFTVTPSSAEAFRADLAILESVSKAEAGCVSYAAFQSADEPHVFTVLESWADDGAFDAHRQAPHVVEFKARCEAMITQKSAIALAPIS